MHTVIQITPPYIGFQEINYDVIAGISDVYGINSQKAGVIPRQIW